MACHAMPSCHNHSPAAAMHIALLLMAAEWPAVPLRGGADERSGPGSDRERHAVALASPLDVVPTH